MTDRVILVSDFNIDPLARLAANGTAFKGLEWVAAPFGQVYQTLSAPPAEGVAAAIVWTQASAVVPSFAKAVEFETVDAGECLAEVDRFADLIVEHARTLRFVFVASWVLPTADRGYGMLDWRPGLGMSNLLARMNLRLAERLSVLPNAYVFDAARWLSASSGSSPRLWYAAKVPYRSEVFEHALRDFAAAEAALAGRSRKLVVVDLDNTLWGGVVGETGWSGIRLGGIDYLGEAFRDFQRELRALTRKGIQVAIVSKNDEVVALQAIDEHPEMLLRRSDFSGWRINWADKAANLQDLVAELNLGPSSVVFIDDNPAERDRIRTALPEVLVPEWPTNPCGYVAALRALDCFESADVTEEDRKRTSMYAEERERRDARGQATTMGDWLASLDMRLRHAPVGPEQIARVAQLFNKTNQLNLSTRRMTATEILEWASQPHRSMLAISVSDRFGDLGLTGVVGVEAVDGRGRLVDFILSCRAMGRDVEEAMLHLAASELARLGARTLEATYVRTERNRPTHDVLSASRLVERAPGEYRIDLDRPYPAPSSIVLEADTR
jgi:FkbH-like protein